MTTRSRRPDGCCGRYPTPPRDSGRHRTQPGTAWPFRPVSGAPESVISRCEAGWWHFGILDGLPLAFIDWDTARSHGPAGRDSRNRLVVRDADAGIGQAEVSLPLVAIGRCLPL